MMWSSVPKVRSGMRTLSFSSLSIWKACGVVTSWIRCRPIRSWVWPDGSVRTVCASHTLSSSVRAMKLLLELACPASERRAELYGASSRPGSPVQLSLSRLNHWLPQAQAHPEVMQGTADLHHHIADALLPEADPVL